MHKCKKRTLQWLMILQNVLYSAVSIISSAHHVNTGFTWLPRINLRVNLFDVNQRFDFAIYGELQRGREALATICDILNMPSRVCDSSYKRHN